MVTISELQDMLIAACSSKDAKLKQQFIATMEDALDREPDKWDLNSLLGTYYVHEKNNALGIPILRYAHSLKPDSSEIMNNLGNAYRQSYHNEQAEYWFRKALAIAPNDYEVYTNMGTLHVNEGTPHVGEQYLRKAIELKNNPKSHWNLSMCLLEQEKWKEGFQEYTYGLISKDRHLKNYRNAPWWDGEYHLDQSIVVYGEQGLGDEIMWASCITDIMPYFKRVIIDCHPRLEGLFRRSFPTCTVYPTRKTLDSSDPANAWIGNERPDFKLSMAELPKWFRHFSSDFPRVTYLDADRTRVEEYKDWLRLMGDGPYIGVSWTGGTKETRKDLRTLSLDTLNPVIDAIDGTFISCQYSSSDEEIRKFEDATGKKIHSLPEVFESARWMRYHVIDDNGDTLAIARKKDVAKDFVNAYGGTIENHNGPAFDYDDTAAFVTAIAELGGYIIAVNGTLVHLCGALGVPCGTLTPSKPAWRYGLKRKNMIWYGDHVRQYRQKGVDWQIAINDLIGELLRKRHAA